MFTNARQRYGFTVLSLWHIDDIIVKLFYKLYTDWKN